MSLGSGLTPAQLLTPKTFSLIHNYEQPKIHLLFLREVDLMHSDIESNTYVLGQSVIGQGGKGHGENDAILDFLIDLDDLNDTPLPFGQIMFFSYAGEGEFRIESATEKYNAHRAVLAFESFGYKGARMLANYIRISEQDQFKLMLKYGY